MKTESISPILQVDDLNKAIEFYCETLGFSKEFAYGEPAYYGGVRIDSVILHLGVNKENKERTGMGSVWIYCTEIDSYYGQIEKNGATVTSPLTEHDYGIKDFQVSDPDGNLICFGQRTK